MAEQTQANEGTRDPKRARKRIWAVAAIALAAFVIATLLWKAGLWNFQSVDERLAAIEAARAIPDEENAAIIYNQLLENYDESSLWPDFMDELDYMTRLEPWSSEDYPELAEWLEDRQGIISTLLEASKKEKCRFPMITDVQQIPSRMEPIYAMRRWSFLLIHAANNDIAEGRIEASIQKYRCLIQMGNHLYQQPLGIDFLVGMVVERVALDGIKSVILQSDVTEKHLKTVEAALPHTKDNWAEISSKIIEFERLYGRKNMALFDRLQLAWQRRRVEDRLQRVHHDEFRRLLADRRSNRILIALRRYKSKNDRWPEKLDDIKAIAPTEIFVDPINGDSFVYKLTDEGFKLYSKGKNNIDDGGDEWFKQEPTNDDRMVWPPKSRKTQKTDPNTS